MSSFRPAQQVLEELESIGTKRKAKLELLTQHRDDAVLQQVFKRAYDWEETFGFKVRPHAADTGSGAARTKPLFGVAAKDQRDPWEAFNELLDQLAKRELTGHAAKEAWNLLALRLSDGEKKWFGRIINRDLRVGLERATVDDLWPGLIRPFGCQLAEPMSKLKGGFVPNKKRPWLGWPMLVEAKYDGMRVLIEYNHETKTCTGFSREGHLLPHVQDLLDPLAEHLGRVHGQSCWVDSEALADGADGFNHTLSLVKKEDVPPEERAAKLKFRCFDFVDDVAGDERPLVERRKRLKAVIRADGCPANFILSPAKRAKDENELREVYEAALDDGHEGVMIKFLASPYTAGRTFAWIKWKPTETLDGTIIGVEPGEAGKKHEHHLGAFVVRRGDTGEVINVGGGFSDVKRDEFWTRREELIGTVVEFKQDVRAGANTTVNFPRFVRLRGDREKA